MFKPLLIRRIERILLDFMEAVSRESKNMMKKQQQMLKLILEAAKIGDSKIEEILKANKQEARVR